MTTAPHHHPRPRRTHLAAAGAGAVALAALAAGCGSSASSSPAVTSPAVTSPAVTSPAVTSPAVTSPAVAQGGAPAVPAGALTATLTEMHIALSQGDVAAGAHTVVATNAGHIVHAVTIQGGGVDVTSGVLQPGQSKTMTVTLAAGTYQVFCPVGNHRNLGMATTLTVGPGAATAATGTSGGAY